MRSTRRFIELGVKVDDVPPMGSKNTRVGAAFEQRCQVVAMFFAVGAPGGCLLLEDAIVGEAEYAQFCILRWCTRRSILTGLS